MRSLRQVTGPRLIMTAAVLIGLFIAGTSGTYAFLTRQDALRQASADLALLSETLAQHARDTFELSNTVLNSVERSIRKSEGTIPEMKSISDDVAAIALAAPRIREVLFAEGGGWVLASSVERIEAARNVRNEPFFALHRRKDAPDFVVAPSGRKDGTVAMSRRVVWLDGSFAGVVAATIPKSYFEGFYASFDSGRDIEVQLRGADGAVVARYAPRDASAASPRVSVERGLGALPFRVSVTQPHAAILRGWSKALPLQCVATAGLIFLTLASGFLLARLLDRKRKQQLQLLHQASADPLTNLANRRSFIERIRMLINQSEATARPFTVLLIDLDQFKSINDLHGHAAGDSVLCAVARRFEEALAPFGMAARLGGDEFAALLDTLEDPGRLDRVLEGILRSFQEPVLWNGLALSLGASIGVATYPADGRDGDTLLQSADLAMYRAKQERGSAIRFFEQSMEAQRRARRQREKELRLAIEGDEIKPYYQPIVAFPDGRIVLFELLARWHHPAHGVLPPADFIELAEETGQITPLTFSLIRQAAADAAAWPPETRLAINISPCQLREPLLAQRLIEALRAGGLDPARVEIELTEDAILDDYELAKSVMSMFRLNGMVVALDDFGTGYSSLSHLRELRFDKLKIDRSFVQALAHSEESRKLVDVILQLAASFEMKVTAEGVETGDQADFLARRGCTFGQGYLFGRPVDAAAAARLLNAPGRVGRKPGGRARSASA